MVGVSSLRFLDDLEGVVIKEAFLFSAVTLPVITAPGRISASYNNKLKTLDKALKNNEILVKSLKY